MMDVLDTAYRVLMFALAFGIFGLVIGMLLAAAYDSWTHAARQPRHRAHTVCYRDRRR